MVTPYVGVWIETFKEIINFCIIVVTPYVGVWIETRPVELGNPKESESHPTWVCGLKHNHKQRQNHLKQSHPTWVCGLKQLLRTNLHRLIRSHPTWVCGLKHPSQKIQGTLLVTPYVGVWIETIC